MRILHITPYFAPAYAFGGVVTAVTELTAAQASQGHRVIVLTTDALDHHQRIELRRTHINGVEVMRVRNLFHWLRSRLNLSTPFEMRHLFRQIKPEVIHVHELRTVENLLTLLLTAPTAPVILSPHGTLTHSTGRGLFKRGWDELIGRALMRRIDAVIALTDAEAEETQQLWMLMKLPVPPITVIPNGARADIKPEAASALRQRYHIPADVSVLLFLGRLHERKGVQLLIPAFAQATKDTQARLLIVGPDEGMLTELRRLAESHGVADRVIFTGLLTGADRDAALATANVFALPAVGEGLSMAALEAMATGLPLLVTPGCNLPDVESRGAGLLVERDIPSLTHGLSRLLSMSAAARQQMGEHGQAWVQESFSWDRVAQQVVEVYTSLSRLRERDLG